MKDYIKRVHCSSCGNYLFTEQESDNKYRIICLSGLNYKSISFNKFICSNCLAKEGSVSYERNAI